MVEKIFTAILGTTIGLVVGISLRTLYDLNTIFSADASVVIVFTILGFMSSIVYLFYQKNILLIKEEKVRNETVALITHEMRTALTSTGWTIEYLLKAYNNSISEDDRRMLLDLIKSMQTTVMHTVNLLDVSLSDIGKLSISLKWTNLSEVEEMVKEVIRKYRFGTKKDDIKLLSEINLDSKKEVEVDMLRLRVILENLLENSIQYINGTKKEIDIQVNNDSKNLNIIVSDTGIGIPPEEKGRIFEEFYRASNARKILSSGSGIGLSITLKYIKAHHGTIRFESKLGEGTTFYITLPLKTSADVNEFLKKI